MGRPHGHRYYSRRCSCGDDKPKGTLICSGCASAECDCGAPKTPGAVACLRCQFLDGDTLPPMAQILLSELRQVGHATLDSIEVELGAVSTRSLYRALAELRRAGRLRRHAIVGREDQSNITTDVDRDRTVEFELVEEHRAA